MFDPTRMSQKIIDNWLSLATYNLATAQDMLKAKKYLYVAFIGELSKLLTKTKAISVLNSTKELFGWIKASILSEIINKAIEIA